jgi:hypothetical protein
MDEILITLIIEKILLIGLLFRKSLVRLRLVLYVMVYLNLLLAQVIGFKLQLFRIPFILSQFS